MENKIKLYGFNNLTKSLCFNIFDVCYTMSEQDQKEYVAYIDEQYNSERLTNILLHVTDVIGAKVLHISKQDYDPQGASATILIAEDSIHGSETLAHLDKSHIAVHTYPEYHPVSSLATFRVDIDVSTCGEISPLNTLDFLISSFDSDIITMDYRIRGFTRDMDGNKLYIDHKISSIQDFIDKETLKKYETIDMNMAECNLFHTRMMIKDIDLNNYLLNTEADELSEETRIQIINSLRQEMEDIFKGITTYNI
ncbi:MAG: adenosylmethionine decarboxylase [Clostridiaceae bacterium]|nr:adenosylmethionine decarboxylase [Clostridiaceae bacterium]